MLLKLFPLPPGVEIAPEGIPEPRVSILDVDAPALPPEVADTKGHYTATVTANTRITAPDWYQDVRHFDLDLEEDIE